MKSILRCLIVVSVCAMATVGLAAPSLQLSIDKIEFGTMPEGPPAQKQVTLTNNGDVPITIDNVSTSCACTNTKLGKNELAPGESTELEITYTTYKFIGKFEKYIWIQTKEVPDKYTITMVGDVTPMPMGVLEVNPRKVSVGDVKVGVDSPAVIAVKNVGDAPMHIVKVESSKSKTVFFDSANAEQISIAPGETREIPITVKPTKPGRYMDYVMIYSDARNVTEQGYKIVVAATGV
ncbi:MAG: DUF1573 domain-containing protein [Desulfopila sp.]